MRVLALLLALCLGTAALPAGAATKLAVSHFPGGGTWPIYAAEAQGYFARQGLVIDLHPIHGSVEQIKGMMDGTYDLGLTALDNVIAYDAGQGEVKLDQQADLFAFMGGEGGSLHLIAAPGIKTVTALKGKTLAVDAKSTGFAFVLYRIAAVHGVGPGDYSLLAVGSSQKRLDALLSGAAQAALLNHPFDGFATAKGCNDLVAMQKVFPHYQSSVGMARRAWAAQHRAALIGFIRAYVEGSEWLFKKAHRQAAIGLLVENTAGLSPAQADSIYRETTGPGSVTSPAAALDPIGVATVVKLRSQYGEPKKVLHATDFYDLSYYRAAVK